MTQLLVYKGFYCSVRVMKEPIGVFFFLLPLQLIESADALHTSRYCMCAARDG